MTPLTTGCVRPQCGHWRRTPRNVIIIPIALCRARVPSQNPTGPRLTPNFTNQVTYKGHDMVVCWAPAPTTRRWRERLLLRSSHPRPSLSSKFGVQLSGPSILSQWERYHRENRKSIRKPDRDTSQENTRKKRRCHALLFHVHTIHAQFQMLIFSSNTCYVFREKILFVSVFRNRNLVNLSSLCHVHTIVNDSHPNCQLTCSRVQ